MLIPTCSGVDVARDAGHRDELGVGRGGGVEQGEAVVDAGVDVEDEGGPFGHRPDASRAHRARAPIASAVGQVVDVDRCARRCRLGERLALRPAWSARNALGDRGRRPAGARRPSRTASAEDRRRRRAARRPRRPGRPGPSRHRASSMTLAAALMTLGSGLGQRVEQLAPPRARASRRRLRASRSSRTVRPVSASISTSESRQRPAESLGQRRARSVDLAGAHQPGDDDVAGERVHARSVCPYTRSVDARRADRAAGRHRHPRWRPARADAGDGGAGHGLPGRGPRSGPRLPGGGRRGRGHGRVVRRRRGGATAGGDECRRDLRARARRGGRRRGARGGRAGPARARGRWS